MTTNALTKLSEVDLEYREVRATAERRIREAVRKEIDGAYLRRMLAVQEAKDEGFSIRKIAREGLHTKDTNTAYKLLDEVKPYLKGREGRVVPEFQQADGHAVLVTPSMEDLAPVLTALSLPATHVEDNPSSAEAVFDYDADSGRLIAVTPAFTPGVGRHPVVALVMASGSEVGKRALEWAKTAAAA